MKNYEQEITLYFELQGTPEFSRESYFRRMQAFIFITFIQSQNKLIEEVTDTDIQHYILYPKKEKKLSAETINNYISGIRWFYTVILDDCTVDSVFKLFGNFPQFQRKNFYGVRQLSPLLPVRKMWNGDDISDYPG